jgi:hypothetical protein
LHVVTPEFWHTHFFTIPHLPTPANSFGIDNASTSAAASRIIVHLDSHLEYVIDLAIGAPVVSNSTIGEFHFYGTQSTVFSDSVLHSLSPKFEGIWFEFCTHNFDDVGLTDSDPFLNGFKSRSVFPCHLDDGGDVAHR